MTADTYTLALSAKYEAEERLGWLRKLVLGNDKIEAMNGSLLDVLSTAILALSGRAPPADARRLAETAMLRVRGAAAILAGARDLSEPPAFD